MQLLVFTAVGLMVWIIAVGFDLGGTIGSLLFLTFVLIGAALRAWAPMVAWVRGPAANG